MKYKNISAEEFKNIREENPSAIILDVRTAGELKQGKIPGATHIDLMDRSFGDKVGKLGKDKTCLVYCRSGNRSGQACEIMAGKGFTNLYNLEGGIGRWPFKIE